MQKNSTSDHKQTVLGTIQRGLCGYLSYLNACHMQEAFNEYILCEPMLRILTSLGYNVECEARCPGLKKSRGTRRKRIDFVARKRNDKIAIELKVRWEYKKGLSVEDEVEKLDAFLQKVKHSRSYLCVVGPKSKIKHLRASQILPSARFTEVGWNGNAAYANLPKSCYGCRIYELSGGPAVPEP